MKFLIAFGTDDGRNLNNDHVGMAKYFYVYEFSNGKEQLVERRENVRFRGDETMKHGDPEKAKATSSVLEGVDVIVGRKFGPNLPRLLGKFVCVVVRTNTITSAIETVRNNMGIIAERKNEKENRKHIVLKPQLGRQQSKSLRGEDMENHASFQDYVIVACGTVNLELNYLKDSGFLDVKKILYTKPGRHEVPRELESQLIRQIGTAKKYAPNIIVVYGGKFCYVNTDNLYRKIDTIIEEQIEPGVKITRIKASHCVDMLASEEEREKISQGKDIYWLTPGWMKYRHYVYQGWDKGLANENFPKHTGGAVMLDAVGYYDKVMENEPEKILEFSDWMGIPIEPYRITLNRLRNLLLDEVRPQK